MTSDPGRAETRSTRGLTQGEQEAGDKAEAGGVVGSSPEGLAQARGRGEQPEGHDFHILVPLISGVPRSPPAQAPAAGLGVRASSSSRR